MRARAIDYDTRYDDADNPDTRNGSNIKSEAIYHNVANRSDEQHVIPHWD